MTVTEEPLRAPLAGAGGYTESQRQAHLPGGSSLERNHNTGGFLQVCRVALARPAPLPRPPAGAAGAIPPYWGPLAQHPTVPQILKSCVVVFTCFQIVFDCLFNFLLLVTCCLVPMYSWFFQFFPVVDF